MTTLTPAGTLYEMDLRLRPNGSSGVLVTSIAAFEQYQESEAWTWEHQALSRARVVYGPHTLVQAFDRVRKRVLSQQRDEAKIRREVEDMRQRMRDHLGSRPAVSDEPVVVDLKQDSGGLADIEFIVQYLILANSFKPPELFEFTDNVRQLDAAAKVGVLAEDVAERLRSHYIAYRTTVHREALQGRGKRLTEDTELAQRRQDVQAIWHLVFDHDKINEDTP